MKENRLAPITGWIRRDVFPTLFTESQTELRLWHEEGADVIPVVPLAAYTAACTIQSDGEQVLPPPSHMLPHLDEHGVEIMTPTPMWNEMAIRGALALDRIKTSTALIGLAVALYSPNTSKAQNDPC